MEDYKDFYINWGTLSIVTSPAAVTKHYKKLKKGKGNVTTKV
jgi:hypothetical protein